MKTENFDRHFSAYIGDWARRNAAMFPNADAMEAAMPDVYTRWLNTPAAWLGGEAPGLYFAKYDDPDYLIRWVQAYLEEGTPPPDPLLDRIGELGSRAGEALCALLGGDIRPEMAMLALGLLSELDGEPPTALYLDLVRRHGGEGEIAARAAEALRSAGVPAVSMCLEAMEGAPSRVRICLMEVLADFPGEAAVLRHALDLLREGADAALMAAYIARIGDDAALPDLYAAAKDPSIDYLTYIEVLGAIDALGGDPPEEREFAGDPAYESLKRV